MKNLLLLGGLIVLGISGCGAPGTREAAPATVTAPSTPAGTPHSLAAPDSATAARRVVYHGEMTLAVPDFDRTSARVDSLLGRFGGYLVTSGETVADRVRRTELTIRVPSERFLPLVSQLSRLGRLEGKRISSEDVTPQTVDLGARLRAKRAEEAACLALMGRAASRAEVSRLAAEAQALRQEIEEASAQWQQLRAEAATATLKLRYYQELPAVTESPLVTVGPRLVGAFYNGLAALLGLGVLLLNFWPALLLGLLGWGALRRWPELRRWGRPAAGQ